MSEFLQQFVNGLALGSIYALIALGYTMVYGVLRLINFAHGDIYMVGAMVGFYTLPTLKKMGVDIQNPFFQLGTVLIAAMLICGLLGVVIERLAYRPLRNAPRLNALITAIGVSLFLEYFGQYLFGADPKSFPHLIQTDEVVNASGVVVNNIQLIIFITSFVLAILLNAIVRKTKTGKAMQAVAFSHTASHLIGINVNYVIRWTFIVGSMLAAVAGILIGLSNPRIDPLMGMIPGLKAFVAAVLGGIGSIPGALIGGLILGVAETLVAGYVSSTYRNALAFVLLIAILLIRPTGILGKTSQEKV